MDNHVKLLQEVGLEFDEKIAKSFPYVNSTLKAHNQGYCMICYAQFNTTNAKADSLKCGHEFCANDWQDYLKTRVNQGYQHCISTTCAQH